ncbi:DUF1835 domain-containing protein [Lysinibacillus sp. NPDC048646]|uniref:DUF1835 domain-containing protein n=1 Tax=Lysinibacillus sp. NPDC048646 TaxID=3390574 RepID=UPI003D045FDA
MKSKVNPPFIYFLMEPNIVFVYKIDTQRYLNISDLSEGKWATFALNHGEEWATFHHEKSEPLEGQSYWFAQQDLVKIVEEINTQIQHYRHATSHEAADARMHAVHIVSSESAAGSIRVALEPRKQVIGFPDAFSIGPLWKLEEEIGQAYRHEWLYENINYELDNDDYQVKFSNTLLEIEDIPHQLPIYIWYGDNADEQIGLRFFLYYLRHKTNEIFLINTTACNANNGTLDNQHYSHTSQMESTHLRRLFEKNTEKKPLTDRERLVLQQDWEALSQ